MPDSVTEADKKSRKEQNAIYARETKAFFHSLHRCSECGTKDAYTMNGRWLCADCAEKYREYNRKYYERNAETVANRSKALRNYRREHHLCTRCGKPLADDYPYNTCEVCRANDNRKRCKRRREKGIIPRSQWRELGLCMRCGAPNRMKGLLAWEHKEIELCEKCYWDSVAGFAKGRAVYAAQRGMTYGNYNYEYENMIRHGGGNKENDLGKEEAEAKDQSA